MHAMRKMECEDEPVSDATQSDRDALAALDDALGFLTETERPIVLEALTRHRQSPETLTLRRAVSPFRDDVPRGTDGICEVPYDWVVNLRAAIDAFDEASAPC